MKYHLTWLATLAFTLTTVASHAAEGRSAEAQPPTKKEARAARKALEAEGEAAEKTASSFKHEPFPAIPRGTIVKNRFAILLPKVCEVIEGDRGTLLLDTLLGPDPTRNAAAVAPAATGAAAAAAPAPAPAPALNAPLAVRVAQTMSVSDESLRGRVLRTFWTSTQDLCTRIQGADLADNDIRDLIALAEGGIPALVFLEQLEATGRQPNGDVTVDNQTVQAAMEAAGKLASGVPLFGTSGTALSDALIQGLAEFLAKRAKQEALDYLRDQLTEQLCVAPRREFFPATCSAIESVSPLQSLESIGTQLKTAATEDLKALPDVSLAFIATRYPESRQLAFTGRLAYRIAREMADGRTLEDLLAQVGRVDWTKVKPDAGTGEATSAVRIVSALAYALQQVDPSEKNWHEHYPDDSPAKAVLLGVLVLAEIRATSTGASFLTVPVANAILSTGGTFLDGILQAHKDFVALQEALEGEDNPLTGEAKREHIADVIELAAAAVANQLRALAEISIAVAKQAIAKAEAPPLAADAKDVVAAAKQAIARAEALLVAADVLKASGEVTASALYGDFATAVVTLSALIDKLSQVGPGESQQLAKVRQFLGFILEVGNAKDSQGVAAAIDAYAAPAGSYRSKYDRPLLAVGALVGMHVGGELINTNDGSSTISGDSVFLAGFAPVGISFSAPFWRICGKKQFHGGVMVSVLDVGALTTYRFDDELNGGMDPTASKAPDISFAQVFSPGAFAVFGVARTPFVIGGGVSFTPELRTITDGTAEFKAPAVRIGGFVAVDVPLFPMN